jgi:hypothetical protein
MVNKWNGIPARLKNGKTSFYYFNNNILVHKEENETQIEDLTYQVNRAAQLKQKAPAY